MFDFELLEVYKKAKTLNKEISRFVRANRSIDAYTRDQLRRASINVAKLHFDKALL